MKVMRLLLRQRSAEVDKKLIIYSLSVVAAIGNQRLSIQTLSIRNPCCTHSGRGASQWKI